MFTKHAAHDLPGIVIESLSLSFAKLSPLTEWPLLSISRGNNTDTHVLISRTIPTRPLAKYHEHKSRTPAQWQHLFSRAHRTNKTLLGEEKTTSVSNQAGSFEQGSVVFMRMHSRCAALIMWYRFYHHYPQSPLCLRLWRMEMTKKNERKWQKTLPSVGRLLLVLLRAMKFSDDSHDYPILSLIICACRLRECAVRNASVEALSAAAAGRGGATGHEWQLSQHGFHLKLHTAPLRWSARLQKNCIVWCGYNHKYFIFITLC